MQAVVTCTGVTNKLNYPFAPQGIEISLSGLLRAFELRRHHRSLEMHTGLEFLDDPFPPPFRFVKLKGAGSASIWTIGAPTTTPARTTRPFAGSPKSSNKRSLMIWHD